MTSFDRQQARYDAREPADSEPCAHAVFSLLHEAGIDAAAETVDVQCSNEACGELGAATITIDWS